MHGFTFSLQILILAYTVSILLSTHMKKIDARKIEILKYIVEDYIQTGDIAGSKSFLRKHPLDVSPATVRNDMSSLEKMGLIFQPYNSAGRLPTTR